MNLRILYIDIAKALGMLFIIWGHIRLSGITHNFVYAFHIPLYFFLSGMFFNKRKYVGIVDFVSHKAHSLLYPYVLYSFFFWIVWVCYTLAGDIKVESYWNPLLQTFIAQGSDTFLVHDVPLWFVSCLFVMEVIYYLISGTSVALSFILSIILCAFSYCLILYCDTIDFTMMPWSMDVSMLGLPFFALGHISIVKFGHKRIIELIDAHKWLSGIASLLLFVSVIAICRYNGSISFGHTVLGRNVGMTYLGAVLGIAMMLILSILFAESSYAKRGNSIISFLGWIGKNSFAIMAVHCPIKSFISIILGFLLHCSSICISKSDGYSVICFVVTCGISFIFVYLLNFLKDKCWPIFKSK